MKLWSERHVDTHCEGHIWSCVWCGILPKMCPGGSPLHKGNVFSSVMTKYTHQRHWIKRSTIYKSLVVELLAVKIWNSELINGIQLNVKISQMAADTCLFLKDRSSITEALCLLKFFSIVFCLKMNKENSKAYNVGKAIEKLKIDETSGSYNYY